MKKTWILGFAGLMAACTAPNVSEEKVSSVEQAYGSSSNIFDRAGVMENLVEVDGNYQALVDSHFSRLSIAVNSVNAVNGGNALEVRDRINQARSYGLLAGAWAQPSGNTDAKARELADRFNGLFVFGQVTPSYIMVAIEGGNQADAFCWSDSKSSSTDSMNFPSRFVNYLRPELRAVPRALVTDCLCLPGQNPCNWLPYNNWRNSGFTDVFGEAYWSFAAVRDPYTVMNALAVGKTYKTVRHYYPTNKVHATFDGYYYPGPPAPAHIAWSEYASKVQTFEQVMEGGYGGIDVFAYKDDPNNPNHVVPAWSDFRPLVENYRMAAYNPCTSGSAPKCISSTSWQACYDTDANGTTEWGPTNTCPSGTACSGGSCVASCTSNCTPGAPTQCTSATTYKACVDVGGGCYQWSAPAACPAPTTSCYEGNCVVADATVEMSSQWLDYGNIYNASTSVSIGGGVWSDPSAPLITGQWDGISPWANTWARVVSYGSLNMRVDLYSGWGACQTGYAETGYTLAGGGESAWSAPLITSAWNGSGAWACLQARLYSSFRQCKLALSSENHDDCTHGPVYASSSDGAWSAPLLTSDIAPWGCLRFQLQCQ